MYESLITIVLGCCSSFLYKTIDGKTLKIITGGSSSIALFLILMLIAFFNSFGGSLTIRQTWDADKNYRVEYMEDAGFSGAHLLTYRLDKISIIPIYVKEIESVRDNDTAQNCNIAFAGNNLTFNKCTGQLTKMNTRNMFIKLNQK
ncbi:MAG TPA: hypothetical protein VNZ45_05680 [Bacteroidia bacterium]|jgi:hypothetical protein|nr:hypothetical protein [Bacteroidia bacterium]